MVRRVVCWASVAALTVVAAVAAWAADIDGKWTWKQTFGENEIAYLLELKQDGEKLTGSVTVRDQKSEITEGSIKGADVSFALVRRFQDREFKTTYKGKLEGDTIKGVSSRPGRDGGQPRETPWEAKREK
jgi:hypothetical protein